MANVMKGKSMKLIEREAENELNKSKQVLDKLGQV
jgi:hypothetical protein